MSKNSQRPVAKIEQPIGPALLDRISWDDLKARALSANVRYGLQLQKSFPSLRRRNPSEDGCLVL